MYCCKLNVSKLNTHVVAFPTVHCEKKRSFDFAVTERQPPVVRNEANAEVLKTLVRWACIWGWLQKNQEPVEAQPVFKSDMIAGFSQENCVKKYLVISSFSHVETVSSRLQRSGAVRPVIVSRIKTCTSVKTKQMMKEKDKFCCQVDFTRPIC